MKALVKRYAKPGIWMEDVPMPEVGVNDVLIKVKKAAAHVQMGRVESDSLQATLHNGT